MLREKKMYKIRLKKQKYIIAQVLIFYTVALKTALEKHINE